MQSSHNMITDFLQKKRQKVVNGLFDAENALKLKDFLKVV